MKSSCIKLYKKVILSIIIIFFILPLKNNASSQPGKNQEKRILILYSYSAGRPAYQKINPALISTFKSAGISVNNLHMEYLDLVRASAIKRNGVLREYFLKKYGHTKIDLLITVHIPAFNFISAERDLFPGTPLVGLFSPEQIDVPASRKNIILMPQIPEFGKIIEQALKLFPNTQRIIFMSGTGEAEKIFEAAAKKEFQRWTGRLEFEFTSNFTVHETFKRISALPDRSAVIYSYIYEDVSGNSFIAADIGEYVANAANAPVFGIYDVILGKGIVGGLMTSYEAEAERAAKYALGILDGSYKFNESIVRIPAKNDYIYDWNQLKRWHADMDLIPDGATLINTPPSLWKEHRGFVIASIAFISIQTLMIIALLIQNKQKKIARDSQARSERQYRELLDNINMLALILDSDGNITYTNEFLSSLLGYTNSELIGLNWHLLFINKDQRDEIYRQFKMCVTSGIASPHHLGKIITKNGEERSISWSNTLIKNSQGKATGIASLGEDITSKVKNETLITRQSSQLKEANENLDLLNRELIRLNEKTKKSEAKYRTVANFNHDWEYWIDENGKYVFISPSCERIAGYTPLEFMSDTELIMRIVHPDDCNLMRDHLSNLRFKPAPHNFDFRIIAKNGEEKWISHMCTPVYDESGCWIGQRGSNHDITDRKIYEKTIQESLIEKEALLRELYHRTKNNMQVISAMLELQSTYINDACTAGVFREMQNRIQSMAIVHQKLYQSKMLSSINLKEYISDLSGLLLKSYQVSAGKISIKYKTADIYVMIDHAIPCGLILNELISNSLKHAFPGEIKGTILIELRRPDKNSLLLKVSDNGAGVPEEFNLKNNSRMGLQSVIAIGEHQLGGKVSFDTVKGFSCEVLFKDNNGNHRV